MKLKLLLCAACLGLASRAFALTLPGDIAVEAPAGQRVTYQVLPFYDANKKVLAQWNGDQLTYYVSLQVLPAGTNDPDAYIQSLIGELKAAGGSVTVGRHSTYKAGKGFRGTAQVLSRPDTTPATPPMVVHVLTDGSHAYLAIATGVETMTISPDELLKASTDLLRSVHAASAETPAPQGDFEAGKLVGDWVCSENRGGRAVVARIHMAADRSFATQVSVNGKKILDASGTWQLQGEQLSWSYLHSRPELPEAAKQDVDVLLATQPDQLVIRSNASGQQRTLTRERP